MLGCTSCKAYFGIAGLGDCSTDVNGDVYCTDMTGSSGSSDIIPYGTAAGTMTGPNPTSGQLAVGGALATTNPSSGINWNSIANIWAQTGAKIALAAGGAQPTFTTTGANGATTSYYGNPAYMSTLPASLTNMFSGSVGGISIGTLAIAGVAVLVLMNMGKK